MKVVINKCYGGFGLSAKAQVEYAKRKGFELYFYDDANYKDFNSRNYKKITVDEAGNKLFVTAFTKDFGDKCNQKDIDWNKYYFSYRDIERNDPDLVAVVESLGTEADGSCAELKIVEVPDDVDYQIDEYDGVEWIAETHRTWS